MNLLHTIGLMTRAEHERVVDGKDRAIRILEITACDHIAKFRHTADTPPSPCIERFDGRFVIREFPVLVARVRAYKKRNAGELIGRAA